MARDSSIAYEEVAAICAQIAAGGQRPTIARVSVALGGKGSTRVISGYLTRYFEESGSAQQLDRRSRTGWSEEQNLHADIFLNQLRDLALSHAQHVFDSERQIVREQFEALLERVQAAELSVSEKEEANVKLEQSLHQHAELIVQLREERIELQDELERMRAELAVTQGRLEHAIADLISQKDTATLLERELNARREQEVEQLRNQFAAQLDTMRHDYEAKLAREREVAQGERAYLMEQTYVLRQSLTREKEALEEALTGARKDAEQSNTLVIQYRADWAAERGRLEERSVQLAKTEQICETLQAQVLELQNRLMVVGHGRE